MSVLGAHDVLRRLNIPCYNIRFVGDGKCAWRGVLARNPEEAERLWREWYMALSGTEQPEVESIRLDEDLPQYGMVSIPGELAERLQKIIDEWMAA